MTGGSVNVPLVIDGTNKLYNMKKVLFTVIFMMTGTMVIFAQKYMTRTGKVSFDASVPAAPEVKAINNEMANILDAKTGEIVFQVPIKSFKFERALMQEHFNENYMESDKYPKSEFKGNIVNLNEINFTKDGTYTAKVTGKLMIHGVTKEISVQGTATVAGNKVLLKAKFSVKVKDYDITIPSLVTDKLGREATITLESDLTQK